jgi:hypothetical protein
MVLVVFEKGAPKQASAEEKAAASSRTPKNTAI